MPEAPRHLVVLVAPLLQPGDARIGSIDNAYTGCDHSGVSDSPGFRESIRSLRSCVHPLTCTTRPREGSSSGGEPGHEIGPGR